MIAGQRWWTGGGLEPTKQYLLSSLHTSAWLLREASVTEWMHRIAETLAGASHQPVRTVKGFWKEIRQATADSPEARTIPMRRVLGDYVIGHRNRYETGVAARAWVVGLSAVLHDPHSLKQPTRLLHLYRALATHPASAAGVR